MTANCQNCLIFKLPDVPSVWDIWLQKYVNSLKSRSLLSKMFIKWYENYIKRYPISKIAIDIVWEQLKCKPS